MPPDGRAAPADGADASRRHLADPREHRSLARRGGGVPPRRLAALAALASPWLLALLLGLVPISRALVDPRGTAHCGGWQSTRCAPAGTERPVSASDEGARGWAGRASGATPSPHFDKDGETRPQRRGPKTAVSVRARMGICRERIAIGVHARRVNCPSCLVYSPPVLRPGDHCGAATGPGAEGTPPTICPSRPPPRDA